MKKLFFIAPFFLMGCATGDYSRYAESQARIAEANAHAQRQKMEMVASIAATGDHATKTAALMLLAMDRGHVAPHIAPPEDRVFKWASILIPTAASIGGLHYAYKTSAASMNAQRDIATSSYEALGSVATTPWGFAAGLQPSVTTTTTTSNSNSIGGSGVIGDGSYSVPTTSTNTDNSRIRY